MPSWKKVITSGSNAVLNQITASGDVNINGDLVVDTDTLYVDSSNNRVGIDRVPTESNLELSGTGTIGIGTNIKFQGGTSGIGNSSSLTLLLDGTNRDFYINTRGNGSGEGTSGVQERFRIGTNGAIFSNIKTISGSVESTGSFGAGYIDNKLGIGTTSPDEEIHIVGNNASIKWEESGGSIGRLVSQGVSSGTSLYTQGSTPLHLATNTQGPSADWSVRLAGGSKDVEFAGNVSGSSTSTGSFGAVGIGTAPSNYKLNVEGTVRISGLSFFHNVNNPQYIWNSGNLTFRHGSPGSSNVILKLRSTRLESSLEHHFDDKIVVSGDITGSGNLEIDGNISGSSSSTGSFGHVKAATSVFTNLIENVAGSSLKIKAGGNDVILDTGDNDIQLHAGGSEFARLTNDSNTLAIKSSTSNADIVLNGVDSGANITALRLDMSEKGKAIFNSDVSGSSTSTGSFGRVQATTIGGNSPLNIESPTLVGDTDVEGNLTVTGDITAQNYIVSSSVTYMTQSFSSGSTMFGDDVDDTHQFTGSVFITGSKLEIDAPNAELHVGTSTKGYIAVGTQGDYSNNYTDDAAIGINTVHLKGTGTNVLQIRNHSNNGYGTILTDKYKIVNGGGILSSNGRTFFTISEGGSNAYAIGAIGTTTSDTHTLKIFSTGPKPPLLVGSGSTNIFEVTEDGVNVTGNVSGSATSTGSFGLITNPGGHYVHLEFNDGAQHINYATFRNVRFGGKTRMRGAQLDVISGDGAHTGFLSSHAGKFTVGVLNEETLTFAGNNGSNLFAQMTGSYTISGSATGTGSFGQLDVARNAVVDNKLLVNTTNDALSHVIIANGTIGGSTFSQTYINPTGGNLILGANNDVQSNQTFIPTYDYLSIPRDLGSTTKRWNDIHFGGDISGSSTTTGSFGDGRIAGKLGIQTTTPRGPIDVKGSAGTMGFYLSDLGTAVYLPSDIAHSGGGSGFDIQARNYRLGTSTGGPVSIYPRFDAQLNLGTTDDADLLVLSGSTKISGSAQSTGSFGSLVVADAIQGNTTLKGGDLFFDSFKGPRTNSEYLDITSTRGFRFNDLGTGVKFQVDGTHNIIYLGTNSLNMTTRVYGDLRLDYGDFDITGSATSTASFGTFIGDGSQLTGISSDSFSDGTATLVSGSSTSTGSFGKVESDLYKVGNDNFFIGQTGGAPVSSGNLILGSLNAGKQVGFEIHHSVNPVSLRLQYDSGGSVLALDNVHQNSANDFVFKKATAEYWRMGTYFNTTAKFQNNAYLRINNTVNDFMILNSSDTSMFYIDHSTGNVGIGNFDKTDGLPQAKLTVDGDISGSSTSTGSFGSLVVADKVQGDLEIKGNLFINDGGLDLDSGQLITGQKTVNGTAFTFLKMYDPGDASIQLGSKHSLGYISFQAGNGSFTERMRIKNNGDIAIFNSHLSGSASSTGSFGALQVKGSPLIHGNSTGIGIGSGATALSPDRPFIVSNGQSSAAAFIGNAGQVSISLIPQEGGTGSVIVGINTILSFRPNGTQRTLDLRSTGRVGMGTTNPQSKLDILDDSNQTALIVSSSTANGYTMALQSSGNYSGIVFRSSGGHNRGRIWYDGHMTIDNADDAARSVRLRTGQGTAASGKDVAVIKIAPSGSNSGYFSSHGDVLLGRNHGRADSQQTSDFAMHISSSAEHGLMTLQDGQVNVVAQDAKIKIMSERHNSGTGTTNHFTTLGYDSSGARPFIISNQSNTPILFKNNAGSIPLAIHTNQYVGVNNTSPGYRLDVLHNGDDQFRVGRSGGKYVAIRDDVMQFTGMTGNGMRIQTSDNSDIKFSAGTGDIIFDYANSGGRVISYADIRVHGDIIAENYIVSSSTTYMTTSFSAGSTAFGDTPSDDTHQFTGSLTVTGSSVIANSGQDPTAILSDPHSTSAYGLHVRGLNKGIRFDRYNSDGHFGAGTTMYQNGSDWTVIVQNNNDPIGDPDANTNLGVAVNRLGGAFYPQNNSIDFYSYDLKRTRLGKTQLVMDNDITFTVDYNKSFIVSGSKIEFTPTEKVSVTGNLEMDGTITEASTMRIKTNIETLESPLDKITKLRGVSYNLKKNNEPSIGMIAEEVEEVFPELVSKDDNGKASAMSYGRMTAVLLEAIKELKQEVDELRQENIYIKDMNRKNK